MEILIQIRVRKFTNLYRETNLKLVSYFNFFTSLVFSLYQFSLNNFAGPCKLIIHISILLEGN